jgi:hypothetical protein
LNLALRTNLKSGFLLPDGVKCILRTTVTQNISLIR